MNPAIMIAASSTYKEAVSRLNALQSGYAFLQENREVYQLLDSSQRRDRHKARLNTQHYLSQIGITSHDLEHRAIHVAGTNGKGSTCTYISRLLSSCCDRLGGSKKIGLYTSPHLSSVRERISINGRPISEEMFARYFFDVYDRLSTPRPGYFRFLTILSFYVFVEEDVGAAVIETGVGGEYDATNVFHKPAVSVITRISIDHQRRLGEKVEDIAWHKGGILKPGCNSISVSQSMAVRQVLDRRAEERQTEIEYVGIDDRVIDLNIPTTQKCNASAAIKAVELFLRHSGPTSSLSQKTIEDACLLPVPGRFHAIQQGNISWHLDSAHNGEGLEIAAKWYKSLPAQHDALNILIFSHHSQRDAARLLRMFYQHLCAETGITFPHVIFCTDKVLNSDSVDLVDNNANPDPSEAVSALQHLRTVWKAELCKDTDIKVRYSVEEAVSAARDLAKGKTRILATGHPRLIGPCIAILDLKDTAN